MLMMDDDSIIGKTTKRCRFAADEKKDVDDLVKEGRSVVEISMQWSIQDITAANIGNKLKAFT